MVDFKPSSFALAFTGVAADGSVLVEAFLALFVFGCGTSGDEGMKVTDGSVTAG